MKKNKLHLSDLPNSTYIFIVAFVAASLIVPKFFTPGNIATLLLQSCIMMILSMGMAMTVMMGGIDLSMGGALSMTGVIMAICLRSGAHAAFAIPIGLIAGTLFGAFSGLVITKLKVPPFIATFGAGGVAQSISNILSGKRTVSWEAGPQNELINFLGSNVLTISFGPTAAQTLSISMLLVITLIVIALVLIVFKTTTLGSNIYALGANEETARLSGIATEKWKIGIYMTSGFLTAVAGLVGMIRTNSLQPTLGEGLEFYAVVAAVLGGNSLAGGKGSIPGALLGALTLYTVRNAMSLWGIDTSVVMVVIGVILVFGMFLNGTIASISESIEKRKKSMARAKRKEA